AARCAVVTQHAVGRETAHQQGRNRMRSGRQKGRECGDYYHAASAPEPNRGPEHDEITPPAACGTESYRRRRMPNAAALTRSRSVAGSGTISILELPQGGGV